MAIYDRNLLPDAYDTVWALSGASRVNSNTGILFTSATGYAKYAYNTTGFDATGYILVKSTTVTGNVFLNIDYVDSEDNKHRSHVIRLSANMELPLVLQSATVDSTITFTLYTTTTNSQVGMVEALLMEQAIRAVDIEYASGTSKATPPETGWSTTAPQWQTGHYIWQRTATTFVDGHTEYSDPICLQNTESAGIDSIEEEYYLSTSSTSTIGGSWSTTQPTWSSGKYIWTRSKITWTDQRITYSDATVAQALNQANQKAQDAAEAVTKLDTSLNQEGIFNRLTNNGQVQGLFLEDGKVYINATYIQSGTLIVRNTSNQVLFRAAMDSNSVYIAGFTVNNLSMYAGNCVALEDSSYGIYMGTNGYTSGNGSSHITMTQAEIHGGSGDSARTGYLNFNNYWNSDGTYACRLGGMGGVFIFAPRIGIAEYQYGGDATVTLGKSGVVSVPNAANMQANYYVTNLQSNGSGGYTWHNYFPGTINVSFTSGLMSTTL